MNKCLYLLVSCVVAALACALFNLAGYVDLLKDPMTYARQHDDTCRWIGGFKIDGFEDMAYLNTSHAVACAGDLIHLFANASYVLPHSSRGSTCVLMFVDGANLRVEPLPFVGDAPFYPLQDLRPSTRLLHLHGIDVVRLRDGTLLLFGVNHAFRNGGETIEVFAIDVAGRELHHRRTIALSKTMNVEVMGVLNDLAVDSVDSSAGLSGIFFVTKYLEFADSLDGRAASGLLHKLTTKASLYGRAATGRFATLVYRCTFAASPDAARCEAAVTEMFMANGVVAAQLPLSDRSGVKVVVIVDVLAHRLVIAPAEGPFPITCHQAMHVPLLHAVDNIVVSAHVPPSCSAPTASGTVRCVVSVYGGAVASIMAASVLEDHVDKRMGEVRSPGGTTRIDIAVDVSPSRQITAATKIREEVVVMHDGGFHGTSVGIVLASSPTATQHVVMGSYKLEGLLHCPLSAGHDPVNVYSFD